MVDTETIIGSTIAVRGKFKSDENVMIHGKIVGQIEVTADLAVEKDGTIEAEVVTQSVDIRGKIIGNVVASDRVEIHPGGSVSGDVRAPRVILTDGCKYNGHIEVVAH